MPEGTLPQEKRCSNCAETKPLEDFYRHRGRKDGRQASCKMCNRAQLEAWARENPEAKAASNKRSMKRWRERLSPEDKRAVEKRRRERQPDKHRARDVLRQAVRDGRVSKPSTCEDCGDELERRLIHAHHTDYSKPLDVEWLCQGCHTRRHRNP